MRATLILSAALALTAGCGGAPLSSTRPAGPAAATSGVWADGTVLRGEVTIPAGSTVTLAPGAKIRAVKGAGLVVAGSLLAPEGGELTGDGWSGLTIDKGGTATLKGVELSGMSGASVVKGTLDGERISYDKAGNPGIVVVGGILRLRDSVLFGNGEYDGDMITTSKAREVTVSDTEVKDVHCAFHLVGVGRLTLDRLSLHDNAYGFMAYGSNAGEVHRITDTDVFDNRDFGLQETPGVEQGRIVVDGGYWGDNGSSEVDTITQVSGKIERINPAAAR